MTRLAEAFPADAGLADALDAACKQVREAMADYLADGLASHFEDVREAKARLNRHGFRFLTGGK
ncbi:MAG: hypothetical protein M3P85_11125 [Actinomycetota bacterium]|nr:hypothetical protein [Actinomycetota bacterium]